MDRLSTLRRGLLLESATLAWNVIEGVVAVGAGAMSGSVALVGFGVDSFIETASAAVVYWRLREEARGPSTAVVERTESIASRTAGALLLALAVYIVADAGRRLLGFGAEAEASLVGIALTAASLVVMPFLGLAKLATARSVPTPTRRSPAPGSRSRRSWVWPSTRSWGGGGPIRSPRLSWSR
jgi:divalent metal cation (Fe/Co/Zn/Cd) transporter